MKSVGEAFPNLYVSILRWVFFSLDTSLHEDSRRREKIVAQTLAFLFSLLA
jgi:hypothetical protein